MLAINGEIYNHLELKGELQHPYKFLTGSDCEVINASYRTDTAGSFLNKLNGIFVFALWDRARRQKEQFSDDVGYD